MLDLSAFFTRGPAAFWKGWKLTLVMISVLPLLALCGLAFGTLMGRLSTKSSEAYGRANSIVQQACSRILSSLKWLLLLLWYALQACALHVRSICLFRLRRHSSLLDDLRVQALVNIRTVMAFNGQEATKEKYRSSLAAPQNMQIRQGVINGLTLGTLMGVMYGSYALSLWVGGLMDIPPPPSLPCDMLWLLPRNRQPSLCI